MGHSIGISDSYYKITEEELLTEYLKALDYLTFNNESQLQIKVSKMMLRNQKDIEKSKRY